MIAVIIKGPSFAEALRQIRQASSCADLAELRLDSFNTRDPQALKTLCASCPLPLLFTLRSRLHGGCYAGSEEQRCAELSDLAALAPDYLDVESDLPVSFIQSLSQRHPSLKLILSHHDLKAIPDSLDALYQRMQRIPAHFYKIAVTPPNSAEALRFMEWAKSGHGRLIAVAMGSESSFSRLLPPVIDSPITYATLEEELTNPLSQLSAHQLLERYRYRALTPHTALYGLIGDPIDRSPSDRTHNHLFETFGLDALYLKIPVRLSELSAFLEEAKRLPFSGLSVTMPLKTEILPLLDEIDQEALLIGAVNTLQFEGSKILGCNTDGIGALNAIEGRGEVKGRKMVVLGAGGAARAIAYEATRRGCQVTLINRSKERAKEAARSLGCTGGGWDCLATCARAGYDFLINCTPHFPPIDNTYILPGILAMDLLLQRDPTPFLQQASARGCAIMGGYPMFIEQAAGQFSLWFRGQLETERLRTCLKSSIG